MPDRAKKAALKQELEAINYANSLYMSRPVESRTDVAKAEYRRRMERLSVIKEELAHLGPNRRGAEV